MKAGNQLLALDICDYLVDKAGVSLHSQIGSKEFLGKLINLLKSRDSPQIQVKILGLIKKWGDKFEKSSDILPNYSQIYKSLANNGVNFPNNFSSDYNKYPSSSSTGGNKKTSNLDKGNNNKNSNAPSSFGYNNNTNVYSSGLPTEPVKLKPDNFKKKFKKFVEEMNVVIENIQLANQIIDASTLGEEVDDSLRTIMLNLKNCEDSLAKAISTQITDEALLGECCKLNDDLNQTRERYDMLKSKYEPIRFKSAFGWTTYVEETKSNSNNKINNDFGGDNSKKIQKKPNKEDISKVIQPSEDIFGFFSDNTTSNTSELKNNNNNNNNNSYDPFGVHDNNNNNNNNNIDFNKFDPLAYITSSNNNNDKKPIPKEIDFSSTDLTTDIKNFSSNNNTNNISKVDDLNILLSNAYSNNNINNYSTGFDNNLYPSHSSVMNVNNNISNSNPNFNNMSYPSFNNNNNLNNNLNNMNNNFNNMNLNNNFNNNMNYNNNNNNINKNIGMNYNNNNLYNNNMNNNMNFNMNNNLGLNNNNTNSSGSFNNNNNNNNIVLNKGTLNPSFDIYSSSNNNDKSTKPKDKLDGLNPFA